MEIHFKIIGIILMTLSVIHLGFPKYFNWDRELSALSLMNRQMMYIHTLFIGFVVFLNGLLCFTSAAELLGTGLGRKITLGMAIFWSVRLVVQFFGYSPKLWRGKTFETVMHVLFSMFWIYLCVVFITAYWTGS